MTVDKAALRELVEKATPGPWDVRFDYVVQAASFDSGRLVPVAQPYGVNGDGSDLFANSRLIAAARNALPALLAENDALRAELQARQWQPIETAPHETLVVLGWYESGVFKQEIALASAGERYPGGYSNRWWHGRATHWMPLPPAPPQGE